MTSAPPLRSPVGASWRRRRPRSPRGGFVPVSCSGLSLPGFFGGERETGTRKQATRELGAEQEGRSDDPAADSGTGRSGLYLRR